MSERRLVVIDPAGLHARPAARFVQVASRFASTVARMIARSRPAIPTHFFSWLGGAVRREGVGSVRRSVRWRRSEDCVISDFTMQALNPYGVLKRFISNTVTVSRPVAPERSVAVHVSADLNAHANVLRAFTCGMK